MTEVATEINATLHTGPFVIGAGDVLEIRFNNRTEWNQSVRVRPDGRSTFPLLEEMVAGGNTLAQLQEKLTREYAKILQQPDISLNVSAVAARHVVVMGEVRDPGEIAIEGSRMSLVEAIGRAGGPIKETALLTNVLLVRWAPEHNRQMAWRIDARVDYWGAPVPLLLQPYDVVFVPNTPIDNVDIWIDQYIRRLLPFPYLPIAVQ